MHQVEESEILATTAGASEGSVQVKLEVNEEVIVLHVTMVEKTHIVLFLLVYLHVAVMSHNPLVQSTCRQSIRSD